MTNGEVLPPKLRLEQVNWFASLMGKPQGYPILQNINLEVMVGDRLLITGKTGAGKTSLLRLLNRLNDPTSGKVYLDHQEYRHIPIQHLRHRVMLVPQESKLLGMTVQQALSYPLQLRGITAPTIQERVEQWLELLAIPRDWLERTEVQLSSGQKQLVAIARALVTQPDILLLDEPTANLDSHTASQLITLLVQLSQNHQTTILMVNHQLDLGKVFATRILKLDNSRLILNQNASEIEWQNLQVNSPHQSEDEFDF
ncbi:ABC transporter ATP-binding protein [Calothrix sp. 336/3]|uniref:ABC transporter ATP-binding protein n=1 Tax=Calothrix sp. 336/3 TaxID=1337936 RepID=UPI0004E3978C|nr:ATP-binding cassette domain-containing protein [Calothrix sp. 336/3]AKG21953.1 cobalt ABC transporter [Calothrix sp. 336/3]